MDIAVENITKRYGSQKALDDVSFTVKTGEVVGFLGPNGAGKTTTMKAITCFFAPNTGDIKVGGISVKENPDEVKKYIGYLPETNPLYHEMPVVDYLKYVAGLHGVKKQDIKPRILEMINQCGLEGEKHKTIGELSKGYQQRVGLAQALIHDPKVLVLDEPTAGLDPNQIVEIRQLIKRIGKEKTVILSSHILAEVEATCDRVLIINKGRIVADGKPADLRNRAQSSKEIIEVTIEDGDTTQVLKTLNGLGSVSEAGIIQGNSFKVQTHNGNRVKRDIFDICVKNRWYLTGMTSVETKLEDVFRELTIPNN